MMTDILQNLWDAIRDNDEEQIEIAYNALWYYGLSKETALDILEAGKAYFGRNDPVKEEETTTESEEEES
jgi:hypothetical protein